MSHLRLRLKIDGNEFEAEGEEASVMRLARRFVRWTDDAPENPGSSGSPEATIQVKPLPEITPNNPQITPKSPPKGGETASANQAASTILAMNREPEAPAVGITGPKPRGRETYADKTIAYLRGLIERGEPLPRTLGAVILAAGVPQSSQGALLKTSLPARGVKLERINGLGCRATFRDGTVIQTPAEKTAPRTPATPKQPARRFRGHSELSPESVTGLPKDHGAVTTGRTLFPSTVVDAAESARILVSGQNQRKIGGHVTKGPWKGMPIFTVTLEERATCPSTCYHWKSCYGNGMPQARRHRHGPRFEEILETELTDKQSRFPGGFVVRLHILGDFYSVEYVEKWRGWLDRFPALRVFGYTAHTVFTPVGLAVSTLAERWDRFAIRFSAAKPLRQGATTIWKRPDDGPVVDEGIVCPAQLDETGERCCGNCGLCWAPPAREKTIVFVAHGRAFGKGPEKRTPAQPVAYSDEFTRVVEWLRIAGTKISEEIGGRWRVDGISGLTPREVIRIANDKRVRAKRVPFSVSTIMEANHAVG